MCFGNTETGKKTTDFTANPAVANAATSNLNFAQNLRDKGFTGYSGNQVAPFSGQQQSSFDMTNAVAGGAPGDLSTARNFYNTAGNTNLGTVNPNTISSAMNPYLNQYVNYALAPQIQAQDQQFAQQNKNLDAAATSSGAFGDARAGIEAANLTTNQNLARQGLIGNAYNTAFNTAIGAGAQDVSNNLQGQVTNAGLRQQEAQNQLGAGNAMTGFGMNLIGSQNAMGQQQTAQGQAGLNAAYNQWLMAQQYPFQTAQLVNQTTQTGAQAMPASQTSTTYAPNNSGWALAGAALPFLAAPFTGGMSLAAAPMSLSAGNYGGTGGGIGGLYAEGGDPPVGIPSIVGERGPEVFMPHSGEPPSVVGGQGPEVVVPKKSGTVIPHHVLRAAANKHSKKRAPSHAWDMAAGMAA